MVINPDPSSQESCIPRDCDTIPYPPCLNDGLCISVTDDDNATTTNCSCQSSFYGSGCQFFDGCSNAPCLNGGECYADATTPNQFTCICAEGFEGVTCEGRVPACASSPCSSAVTCVDTDDDGGFECLCLPGFTGDTCSVDIDDCLVGGAGGGNPCENDATCLDGVDSFMCSCPPGFSGPTCGMEVVMCSPDTCGNGGTCVEQPPDGFTCECPPGFASSAAGDNADCLVDVNECLSLEEEPCFNGATCTNTPGSFDCLCLVGFTGSDCGTEIDFCSNNDTCSFRGDCLSLVDGFVCSCDAGFTGTRCEVDLDECDSNQCQNDGTCIEGIGSFTCICDSGFTGALCGVDINECINSPCENNATCMDGVAGFTCSCPPGFSGATCSDQLDFCVGQTCFNGGECVSSISEGSFMCECLVGWSGERCQFSDSVVAKLESCGFPMARDMLADAGLVESSEPLSITNGAPPVSFEYNLAGSTGVYFSGWVWQQSDSANAVLFSFTSDPAGTAGVFISDLTNNELWFYFSTATSSSSSGGEVLNTTFSGVPLRPNAWVHVALAVFTDNTALVNVDGVYSQAQTLQGEGSFEVPPAATVNIARGVTSLSSLDSAEAFSGLVRGVAINRIIVQPEAFDLDALQDCTLECVGGEGESPCVTGSCNDLFGTDRICQCPYGVTGLNCQQMHDRFSLDGSSFAEASAEGTLESLQFSFKTDQPSGDVFSSSLLPADTQVLLQDSQDVGVRQTYCDGTSDFRSVFTATGDLGDLQYHTFTLTDTQLQLDDSLLSRPPAAPTQCTNGLTRPVFFGSPANYEGCVRDVLYNGEQLDSSLFQFSSSGGGELLEGGRFGCTRDTAQFHLFSHLELPQFVSRQSQTITLEFSTRSMSGLLYFSRRAPGDATGDMPNDFVALHVEAGRAVFTLNLGEQDQNVVLQQSSGASVSDGEWHSVTATQNGTMASFYLDGVLIEAESTGPLVLLDTTGSVFVGGVPAASRIAGFSTYAGLDGCVRDLEQNGNAADLQEYVSQTNVRFGVCN